MARGPKMSDEERTRVLQMRHEGVSTNVIAAQLGRSHNMIYRVFKEDSALRCKQEAMAVGASGNTAAQSMQMPQMPPAKTVDQAMDELMRNAMVNMEVAKPAKKATTATAKRQAPNVVVTPLPAPQGNLSALFRLLKSKLVRNQRKMPVVGTVETQKTAPVIQNAPVKKDSKTTYTTALKIQEDTATKNPTSLTLSCQPQAVNVSPLQYFESAFTGLSQSTSSTEPATISDAVTPDSERRDANSDDPMRSFFAVLQKEANKLQKQDLGADVMHLVNRFKDEARLLCLLGKYRATDSALLTGNKRKYCGDDQTAMAPTERGPAIEWTLQSLQVEREFAKLERELMKNKVELALCRQKLQDAAFPPADVDRLFPNQQTVRPRQFPKRPPPVIGSNGYVV